MWHVYSVSDALLTRDETRILSSDDHTLRLWDVATNRQIGPAMQHDRSIDGALPTRDGTRILSWSDKTLRLWDVAWLGHNLMEIACNHTPPDHDLSVVIARYSIKIEDPICQSGKTIPVPDRSSLESASQADP
jgi:WD40 repeat protein